MTLVKLDSGDYINTDFVQRIFMVEDWRVEFVGDITGDDRMPITDSDRDRIVEAMGGEYTEDKSITMKLDHNLVSDFTKVVGREISRKQRGLAH